MKAILEQDHYTLLEVPRFAPKSDIVKAYHRLKAAFDPESLATYSLFSADETKEISARVDLAFQVLVDEKKKETYDRWLARRAAGEDVPEPVFPRDQASEQQAAAAISQQGTGDFKPYTSRRPALRPVPAGGFSEPPGAAPAGLGAPSGIAAPVAAAPPASDAPPAPAVATPAAAPAPRAPVAPPPPEGADEEALRALVASDRERDGGFYRAAREARGLTLQQVTEKTKINLMYMRFIEDNNYRDLPAPVYLRGFLVQMAKFYKLEGPDALADAYVAIAERRKKENP